MDRGKRVALIGDMFGRPCIDSDIEGSPKLLWYFAGIEVDAYITVLNVGGFRFEAPARTTAAAPAANLA